MFFSSLISSLSTPLSCPYSISNSFCFNSSSSCLFFFLHISSLVNHFLVSLTLPSHIPHPYLISPPLMSSFNVPQWSFLCSCFFFNVYFFSTSHLFSISCSSNSDYFKIYPPPFFPSVLFFSSNSSLSLSPPFPPIPPIPSLPPTPLICPFNFFH